MEEDFFLKKMKGVKPIKKDETITKVTNTNKKQTIINKRNETKKNTKQRTSENEKNNTEFNLSFGIVNKELKRGKVKIDRKLDLHGFSLVEAHQKFKNEVIKNYSKNKRCLLVITGKGVYKKTEKEEGKPPRLFYGKIKNSILNWIKEDDIQKYILTYQDAGIEHGGDGAVFIYLRKNKF
tara:strand:+ start:592 stop:1131 length:540 start_codon:yes stop_codon:yes gene_type:complete